MPASDMNDTGNIVTRDVAPASAVEPKSRTLRKLSELMELPVHTPLLERVFDHLSVKEILILCQVNKHIGQVVSSSSPCQLRLRHFYHHTAYLTKPFKTSTDPSLAQDESSKDWLSSKLNHSLALAKFAPTLLTEFDVPYDPGKAAHEGYVVVVNSVLSKVPIRYWGIDVPTVDIGFEIWRMPGRGRASWDDEEEEAGFKRWRIEWGEPIAAIDIKPSENLLILSCPVSESQIMATEYGTISRLYFMCLCPPGVKFGGVWRAVKHPLAKKAYIDIYANKEQWRQQTLEDAENEGEEQDSTAVINELGVDLAVVENGNDEADADEDGQLEEVEEPEEGDEDEWEDEEIIVDDMSQEDEEADPLDDLDPEALRGSIVFLSANIGPDGMGDSEILIAGWEEKRRIWWDWKEGTILGIAHEDLHPDFTPLRYGLAGQCIHYESEDKRTTSAKCKQETSITIYSTVDPLHATKTFASPPSADHGGPSISEIHTGPNGFDLWDIKDHCITPLKTLLLPQIDLPYPSFNYEWSTLECLDPALTRSTHCRDGYDGGRLSIGFSGKRFLDANEKGTSYEWSSWGSIMLKDLFRRMEIDPDKIDNTSTRHQKMMPDEWNMTSSKDDTIKLPPSSDLQLSTFTFGKGDNWCFSFNDKMLIGRLENYGKRALHLEILDYGHLRPKGNADQSEADIKPLGVPASWSKEQIHIPIGGLTTPTRRYTPLPPNDQDNKWFESVEISLHGRYVKTQKETQQEETTAYAKVYLNGDGPEGDPSSEPLSWKPTANNQWQDTDTPPRRTLLSVRFKMTAGEINGLEFDGETILITVLAPGKKKAKVVCLTF